MALPVVAIVGRPNVGKSSLLNTLAGKRISIVDPLAGVTRDRVSAICEHNDIYFELIDTGGYGHEDRDKLTKQIEQQIKMAIEMASLILFVVDVQQEITPLDREVAELLRGKNDRVLLIANKTDTPRLESAAGVLQRLGFGEPMCVSALHARETRSLLDEIVRRLDREAGPPPEPVMKLAIVGRQNVGKSTFINGLAQAPRVIVSEVPGTTRDAIDVRFELDGKTFLAIDTAGIRRKAKNDKQSIDYYSLLRSQQSILRADVVLFMLDAAEKISDVDKKLARFLADQHKPTVIVINKWDLAKGKAGSDDYAEYLTRTLPPLLTAPLAFTTATQDRNLKSTVELAQSLFRQSRERVSTGQLNRAIQGALEAYQPSSDKHGAAPKIYYATQVAVCPPTIVLFVNNPALVREDYRRFMARRLREALPFQEIPIRLLWRAAHAEKKGQPAEKRPVPRRKSRRPGRSRAV